MDGLIQAVTDPNSKCFRFLTSVEARSACCTLCQGDTGCSQVRGFLAVAWLLRHSCI